jgi:hypothetical protein
MGLQIPITESPSLKSSARRPGLDKADIAVRHYSLNFEMAVDRHQDARGKQSGGSLMTHRWREPDSNLYGALPVKSCFWSVAGSLFGAGKPFFAPSPAIRFAERAEGVK